MTSRSKIELECEQKEFDRSLERYPWLVRYFGREIKVKAFRQSFKLERDACGLGGYEMSVWNSECFSPVPINEKVGDDFVSGSSKIKLQLVECVDRDGKRHVHIKRLLFEGDEYGSTEAIRRLELCTIPRGLCDLRQVSKQIARAYPEGVFSLLIDEEKDLVRLVVKDASFDFHLQEFVEAIEWYHYYLEVAYSSAFRLQKALLGRIELWQPYTNAIEFVFSFINVKAFWNYEELIKVAKARLRRVCEPLTDAIRKDLSEIQNLDCFLDDLQLRREKLGLAVAVMQDADAIKSLKEEKDGGLSDDFRDVDWPLDSNES